MVQVFLKKIVGRTSSTEKSRVEENHEDFHRYSTIVWGGPSLRIQLKLPASLWLVQVPKSRDRANAGPPALASQRRSDLSAAWHPLSFPQPKQTAKPETTWATPATESSSDSAADRSAPSLLPIFVWRFHQPDRRRRAPSPACAGGRSRPETAVYQHNHPCMMSGARPPGKAGKQRRRPTRWGCCPAAPCPRSTVSPHFPAPNAATVSHRPGNTLHRRRWPRPSD